MYEALRCLLNRYDSIIVLDTETSGLDFKRDEIIELAAIKLGGNAVPCDDMDYFIKLTPGRRLDAKIIQLTGITDALLSAEGHEKNAACERFCDILSSERPLLVAYNAQFDMNFLYRFLQREGRADILKKVNMLDAMTIYKDRRKYPHKISDAIVAYSLEDKVVNSHRAIDDTKALLEVLNAMAIECPDLEKYINLFGYNSKYGVSGSRISSVTYRPQPYNPTKKLYE